ncbi:putative ankyrin repeat protein [Powai lake megavirus]|uniref:Putative ankyrin repeat protein n=1 Tax=Powai lake megavirus TaxID=1842663 RepID=A0A167RJU3_9VIRU|nr:putative ankyrin repeat protein [Powai lake megavirus]ANB50771.1 putative ankyrin repeat protein [Powai lake megavirus]
MIYMQNNLTDIDTKKLPANQFYENNNMDTSNMISVDNLRNIINVCYIEGDNKIISSKRRSINKILDYFQKNNLDVIKMGVIIDDPDLIDQDMIGASIIDYNNGKLNLSIPVIDITIDIKAAIYKSLKFNKIGLIELLLNNNIKLDKIEPNIMIMTVQTGIYNLLDKFIDLEYNITISDHRVIYQLSSQGKLDILIKILDKYHYQDSTEIICKICIQAILNNHINILEYFLTEQAFRGAPDQMYSFFYNSINCGSKLQVIKFFINNGISIKQNNYMAVVKACQCKHQDALSYFCELDKSVIEIIIKYFCQRTF